MTYTVEFNGSKGWEIGHESHSKEAAMDYLNDCIADGYDARLTVERG